MKKICLNEAKQIKGGASSGTILDGVSSIIDSIGNTISDIGGVIYTFASGFDHAKGEVKFGKDFSISWDDTSEKQIISNVGTLSVSHEETKTVSTLEEHESNNHHDLGFH